MTATEIIDQIIARVLNTPATDGDITNLRTRALEWTTEVCADFRDSYDFSWRYRTENVTIAGGDASSALPERFADVGPSGSVIRVSDGVPLTFISPDEMRVIQMDSGTVTSTPGVYSVYDFDEEEFRDKIQIPTAAGDVILSLTYLYTPPTLIDDEDDDSLEHIPSQYHQSVIIPGVRALAKNQEFVTDAAYVGGKKRAISGAIRGRGKTFSFSSFFRR